MIEYMTSFRDDLIDEMNLYNSKLASSPAGSLQIIHDKDKVKYVNMIDRKKVYISKNKNLIYRLALKKYYTWQVKRLRLKITAIDTCIDKLIKVNTSDNSDDFSDRYPEYYELIKPRCDSSWESEDYSSTASYPDQLKITTSKGINVRSKSEAIIVEALNSAGIPFRYEFDFEFFGRTLHPDFTIKRPRDGKIIIWEHFGLLDESGYRNNAVNKLQIYSSAGYVVGDNLIITFETRERPFSYKKAIDAINEYILS